MNHVTSVAWTGGLCCKERKLLYFFFRGIFIFTHFGQNCNWDQTEGGGSDRKTWMAFVRSEHRSVCRQRWKREPMIANMEQTREQNSWYLHMLSPDDGVFHHVIPPQKRRRQLLLPFVGAITWHYHSKHHFLLFEFQTGASWQMWGHSWEMSIACQCFSFDGPSLVRCLIALAVKPVLAVFCPGEIWNASWKTRVVRQQKQSSQTP